MSAREIKAELSARWRDDPIVGLCNAIVDYVAALPRGQAELLTFGTLSKAVGKKQLDEELIRALTILVSSRVAALDARGLLVDEDDTEHELEPFDFAKARATGLLIHPETGQPVVNFESRVIPFFVPSARFLAADK
jgi:hypothetical protein